MRLFDLRINVIILAFIAIFLAIFSVRLLLDHFLINKPIESLLNQANLIAYSYTKDQLTLVWDGKNPWPLIDLLKEKPIEKRFNEVVLVLEVKENYSIWQQEELIIVEGIKNKQYYTATKRLKELNENAQVILCDNYLYVSLLDQGQLYSLENEEIVPIRLISKVVTENE